MQHNSNRIGTLFQEESEALSEEEKNPHEAAASLIKGEEGVNPRQPKAMAKEIEKVAKLQEGESSSKNEVGIKEEASDQFEIHEEEEEEDPFKLIPENWWYGDDERDNFFFF